MDDTCAVSEQSAEELLCPLRHMLDLFGGKWKLPIVCILSSGAPTRYSTIRRKLGDITNVMLAQSLKDLEAAGIIHREQYNEVPPRVEYTLTEEGRSVVPVLLHNAGWAAAHMQRKTVCGAFCDRCLATM